eukprot:jgi/Chlat1/99/Chrsp1S03085
MAWDADARLTALETLAARFAAADEACLAPLEAALRETVDASRQPDVRTALAVASAPARITELFEPLARHSRLMQLPVQDQSSSGYDPQAPGYPSNEDDDDGLAQFVDNRSRRLAAGKAPITLRESALRPLVLLLRLLRNTCAGVEVATEKVYAELSALVEQLAVAYRTGHKGTDVVNALRAATQAISNLAASSTVNAVLLWVEASTSALTSLAALPISLGLHDPLFTALWNCCRDDPTRRLQLGRNAELAQALWSIPSNALTDGNENSDQEGVSAALAVVRDWLAALAKLLCVSDCLLPTLWVTLGQSQSGFSSQQTLLLEELATVVQALQDDAESLTPETKAFLLAVTEAAAAAVAKQEQNALAVLQASLQLLRTVSMTRDDPGCRIAVVLLLLQLLRSLPPPARAQPADAPPSTSLPTKYPTSNLYPGYRRDIVAVLGNACFGQPAAQQAVRDADGLMLILQHCVVDDENPYLREWGLWAVRNLCEDPENRRQIAELEVQGPVQSSELQKAQLEIVIDEVTKRPRLKNTSTAPD